MGYIKLKIKKEKRKGAEAPDPYVNSRKMYTVHPTLSSPTIPASISRTHHVNVLLLRFIILSFPLLRRVVSSVLPL